MKAQVWIAGCMVVAAFLSGCVSPQGLQNEKSRCYARAFVRECTSRGRGTAISGVNDGQEQARYDRSNPYGPGYSGCTNGVPNARTVDDARLASRSMWEIKEGLTTTSGIYCPTDGSVNCLSVACDEGDSEGGNAGYAKAADMYDVGYNIGYCHPDDRVDTLNDLIESQLNFVCQP